MGCLASKHSDLSEHTSAVLARYHLTPAQITKAYSLFVKIKDKHNRTKTPLQLKLAGDRPIIHYNDLRHTFAIPPSLLSSHLLDLVACEKEGELSFPEFLELTTVVCLMNREQLLSLGYHAFAVNEADELHVSDFVGGLTELCDVYPRIINGADIPVSKLGLLATTTVDALHTPHSGSASAAASPPTPHHLTLSTFRQVMLNQPWFVDLLLLVQEQFQRRTRSGREWNNQLLLLRAKDKAVLAAIDDIVKRRPAGHKKGLKTQRGSESGAGGKHHTRRQSTLHARAMDRIGRRQSSVLPEVGIHELRREMAQLAEEEKSDPADAPGAEPPHAHQPGDESSRSARHGRSSIMKPPSRHVLAAQRKGSFSGKRDEASAATGSPSQSSRGSAHRRNLTTGEADGLSSRARAGSGPEAGERGSARGMRQPSQSHTQRPSRMRNGRSSVDVGSAPGRPMLRRNSTGNSEETDSEEPAAQTNKAPEESKEQEPAATTEATQPLPAKPLGRGRPSVVSTESGVYRSRTNSGLTRVNERVSRADDAAATSDETLSPSVKSMRSTHSSPPSRTRPFPPTATHSSPSMRASSLSASHSRSHTSEPAALRQPVLLPSERPAQVDEQDDQLTRLQAITAQRKLSVSTVQRKSSVARVSGDDMTSPSEGENCDVPLVRRGSVMRDSVPSRSSARVVGELSPSSASPSSIHRDIVRRRTDSVGRDDDAPAQPNKRGSVSREHVSPVHAEAYRKELLNDAHGRYVGASQQQHSRSSLPPSSHLSASPLAPASLRPSFSGGGQSLSPYPQSGSRQPSISMQSIQPMGAWDGGGGGGGMPGAMLMPAGEPYRASFSMQGGVVGGVPSSMPAMYGFAPPKMSLSLSPQPLAQRLNY